MVQNRYTLRENVERTEEWSFTWQIRDDVTLASSCDFCGRSTLRLTYEVARAAETLWICQNCVGRYPISASLDGEAVDARNARAHIHGLTARLKQQTCQDIIRRVQLAAQPDAALEEIVVYFDRNLQLSPQRAARLFSVMLQVGEETNAGVFEVQTRSNAHQQEFGALDEWSRRLVWMALSPQQRRRLDSLGFAPAGTVIHRNTGRRRASAEKKLPA